MKRLVITSISIFAGAAISFAQLSINQSNGYYIDGLRLSQNIYGGTARSTAMGGAFASLGGDMGSFSVNPAGIGVYHSSELTLTPGFEAVSATSNYTGNKNNNMDYFSNLGNLGLVLNFNFKNSGGWVSSNIAFGYTHLNTYNSSYFIEGTTNTTSMVNEFLYYSENKSPQSLDDNWEKLAYDAYIINPDTSSATWNYNSPYSNINLLQRHILNIKGSSGEYYFGFGANYNNELYIGASLNLMSTYYSEDYNHSEFDVDAVTYLNYYQFSHHIRTVADGLNFKIGAIYRPNDMLRFGLSFQTPTITKVTQEYYSEVQSQIKNGDYYDYGGPDNTDEYNVTTPFRAIGGASVIFKQYGLISVDYEFIDYRSIHFSNGYSESDLQNANQDNRNIFRATSNIRVGGELKLGSAYLRGGYAFYASPFAGTEVNKNANTNVISGGIGYRSNDFFIDLAYSLISKKEKYFMYLDNASEVSLNTNNSNILATIGFRF